MPRRTPGGSCRSRRKSLRLLALVRPEPVPPESPLGVAGGLSVRGLQPVPMHMLIAAAAVVWLLQYHAGGGGCLYRTRDAARHRVLPPVELGAWLLDIPVSR
jgi:hypothetical protein